ncbi:MAG: asparaginase [Cryomorphaceae bacterium]|nr:asparaginase [Cryomorphaceae bacterium]
MQKANILLIYTGGTIGMVRNEASQSLSAFNFDALLKQIPDVKLLDANIETASFPEPIDSAFMGPSHWILLANIVNDNRDKYDGFVILHGSDTMAYTASALSFILRGIDKPIILTGAQLPIGILRSDARENIITSLEIAASRYPNGESVIKEVCVYFEYQLMRGNRVLKFSSQQFHAFISPNYPALADIGVDVKFNYENLLSARNNNIPFQTQLCPDIIAYTLFPGQSHKFLRKLVESDEVRGLLLITYGTGNAPKDYDFEASIRSMHEADRPVVNISQCYSGRVRQDLYEAGRWLQDLGVISGKDLTREAAITKMMYLLGDEETSKSFRHWMESSLAGELKP